MARIQPPPRGVHRHLRCPRGSVGRGVVLDGADRLPVVVDCLLVRPAERQQARAKKKVVFIVIFLVFVYMVGAMVRSWTRW